MRVGAVGDHRVGAVHHALADIAVEVERVHHRHAGADHGTHAAQDLGLGVVVLARHHRAVQVEIDPVERPVLGEAADDLGHHALEGVGGDVAVGLGEAPHDREQVPCGVLRLGDETAGREREARVVDQLVPAQKTRGNAATLPKSA